MYARVKMAKNVKAKETEEKYVAYVSTYTRNAEIGIHANGGPRPKGVLIGEPGDYKGMDALKTCWRQRRNARPCKPSDISASVLARRNGAVSAHKKH